MATVTAPQLILANGLAQLSPPNLGGNIAAVVLENLSTYTLVVGVGPSTFYHAPLTAQLYAVPAAVANIVCTSIADPTDTTVSGTLNATWLQAGESVPGTYPVALSSPAAIAVLSAETIAKDINTLGVPNVLVADQIIPSVAFPLVTLVVGTSIGPIDVHEYASLQLRCTLSPLLLPAGTQVLQLTWDTGYVEYLTRELETNDGVTNYVMPVRGGTVTIANINPSGTGRDLSILLVGSNRASNKTSLLGLDTNWRLFGVSALNVGAGAVSQLPALDGLTNYSRFNRGCVLQLVANSIGTFYQDFINPITGVQSFIPMVGYPTANLHQIVSPYAHNIAPTRWAFASTAANASLTAQLFIGGTDGTT